MQACRQELVFISALLVCPVVAVEECGVTQKRHAGSSWFLLALLVRPVVAAQVWRDAEQACMKQLVSLGAVCLVVAAQVWRDAELACRQQLVSLSAACVSRCGCTRAWHDAELGTLSKSSGNAHFSWMCLDNTVGEQRLKSSMFWVFVISISFYVYYC